MDLPATAAAFERKFLDQLSVDQLGLAFEPVKQQALISSTGSTDFGGLFIGFSFFLILSAAILVALLFRLSVDRRSGEIGLLLSLGFPPGLVTRLLLWEGAVIAGMGGVLGLAGAVAFGWLMLAGLRSWWSEAVHAPFLRLHITPTSMGLGLVLSFLTAAAAIAWSIRGLSRLPPHALLAGTERTAGFSPRGLKPAARGRSAAIALCAFGVSVGLVVLSFVTDAVPEPLVFFGSGAFMLAALLAVVARVLATRRFDTIHQAGFAALLRLGLRNAPRHHRRSMLTIALISSASFVIISLQAFRVEVDTANAGKHSGTGGFTLYAESAVPILYDLNTAQGRESLNLPQSTAGVLDGVTVMPFRLRAGDEASCLNLYRPTTPRMIGATDAMIRRGGFAFAATLATGEADQENQWRLLGHTFPDGAIPAIGDESAVKWQLHLGLGKDLMMTDERGRGVRLRFVALLKGSVLQDELIIADSQLLDLFPSVDGYGFFLLETPAHLAREVAAVLERELGPYGFDAGPTAARLADYLAVQNTYLSTFQTLGGFGLIVGTIGMGAVLLRNVWERRGELALMRALGFSRRALGWTVLAENAALVAAGLLVGVLPALVAITPHIAARASSVSWLSTGLTLACVFAAGMMAGIVAVAHALRTPLLPALRME
jgi:ABC-type lipoprotein release transport system permease subunit